MRALVHRQAQARSVELAGASEVVVGDLHSQGTLAEAFQHVDAVYHICPNVNPDELSIGNMMITAARAVGVKQFVFHSVLHPQAESMPHHWYKLRVEETLFASGLPFILLQPASYMQNVLVEWETILKHGVYTVPYSVEAPFSPVDLEDVVRAAAIVLTDLGHVGGTYELAGPEVLTSIQIAAVLGGRLGREVRAEKMLIETWKRRAETSGMGQYQIGTLGKMFEYYDRHGLWGSPRVLRDLIGRPPTRFQEFVERTLRKKNSSN